MITMQQGQEGEDILSDIRKWNMLYLNAAIHYRMNSFSSSRPIAAHINGYPNSFPSSSQLVKHIQVMQLKLLF